MMIIDKLCHNPFAQGHREETKVTRPFFTTIHTQLYFHSYITNVYSTDRLPLVSDELADVWFVKTDTDLQILGDSFNSRYKYTSTSVLKQCDVP